ncbi:MAG: hypothetical protein AAGM67_04130 [Bacteroidota bacterium]
MVALRDALKSDESLATLSEDTLNDGVLRALLVRSCTGQAEFMITDSESGADCWKVLKQEAEDDSPARRATITNMYNGIFLTDNRNFEIKRHIAKLDNLVRLLKATGCELDDNTKSNRLLTSLMTNEYYINFVKTLRRQHLSYQELKRELIDDSYQAKHMFKELNRYSNTQKSSQATSDQSSKEMQENSQKPSPALLNMNKRKGNFGGKRLSGRCYNCNIYGHRAMECRRRYGGASEDFDRSKWPYTPEKTRKQGNENYEDNKRRKAVTLMFKAGPKSSELTLKKPLILDTGASDHVAVDPDRILDITDFHEEVISATQVVQVAQRCEAHFELPYLSLVLTDAIYIPTGEYNLISVGKAILNGSIPKFENNGKTLSLTLPNGQTLVGRRNSSNLWKVKRIKKALPRLLNLSAHKRI